MKFKNLIWSLLAVVLLASCTSKPKVEVSGELKKWHKVTLSFQGPETSERAEVNPFTDYRLDVTFTKGNQSFKVPGYYAADGKAAYSSDSTGNVWRVHFAPNDTGVWNYKVQFVTGANVAVKSSKEEVSAGFMDGMEGTLTIEASDKTGKDMRAKGRLEYVGEHYLRFAETGEYFIKMGTDAPENMLAYADFDETPNVGKRLKKWEAHLKHYDNEADAYLWGQNKDKGKALLGAMKYLSDKGCNAVSFLTFNFDGDDRNVLPNLLKVSMDEYEAYANVKKNKKAWETLAEQTRFDVSKLDQWEKIFEYAESKGLFLHFKTQETENDHKHDGGEVKLIRKLYYRELIARYGHHLALNWNLGEENTQTTEQHQQMAKYFADSDPYKNLVVLHTYPNQQDKRYRPLLGYKALTGLSVQTNFKDFRKVYPSIKKWVETSDSIGHKWVVSCDEPGDAGLALVPDADDPDHDVARINGLWGTWMAGGAGTEWYFGYKKAHSDLTCEDYASRDLFWDQGAHGVEFLQHQDVPLWNMKVANEMVDGDNWVLYGKNGLDQHVVLVYAKKGGKIKVDVPEGEMECGWFNPKTGEGKINLVKGYGFTGGKKEVFETPGKGDWILLITQTQEGEAKPFSLSAVKDFSTINLAGYVPAYIHKQKNALAINAIKYRGVYGAAVSSLSCVDGTYDITLNTLAETDGESTYNLFVNEKFIGTFQNPETTTDYKPTSQVFKGISVNDGDVIKVEFNSHSNGKIPEGDGHAFSRGRWTSLNFTPSK